MVVLKGIYCACSTEQEGQSQRALNDAPLPSALKETEPPLCVPTLNLRNESFPIAF